MLSDHSIIVPVRVNDIKLSTAFVGNNDRCVKRIRGIRVTDLDNITLFYTVRACNLSAANIAIAILVVAIRVNRPLTMVTDHVHNTVHKLLALITASFARIAASNCTTPTNIT